jgi:outer membrane protein assembly factor BamD (BamD/ComL family)
MTADEAMPKKQEDAQTRPPAAWLEDIRALLRQGRAQEAATELAAFRRAYPDYVLPQDLRALPLR